MNSAEVFKNQKKTKNNYLPASLLEVHWLCQQMRFWAPTWKPRTPTKQWEGRSSHEKSKVSSLQGKRNRVWHLSSCSGTQEQPYRSNGNWSCTAVVGLTLIKETPTNHRATETSDSPLQRIAARDLRDTSVTTLLVQYKRCQDLYAVYVWNKVTKLYHELSDVKAENGIYCTNAIELTWNSGLSQQTGRAHRWTTSFFHKAQTKTLAEAERVRESQDQIPVNTTLQSFSSPNIPLRNLPIPMTIFGMKR